MHRSKVEEAAAAAKPQTVLENSRAGFFAFDLRLQPGLVLVLESLKQYR